MASAKQFQNWNAEELAQAIMHTCGSRLSPPPLPESWTASDDALAEPASVAAPSTDLITPPALPTSLSSDVRTEPASTERMLRRVLRSFDYKAAVYASAGFVAGMVAWHFVGFWGFVSDVVLNNSPSNQSVFATLQTPQSASTLETGSLPDRRRKTERDPCIELRIDRTDAEPDSVPCGATPGKLTDGGIHSRRDRETLAQPRSTPATSSSWEPSVDLNIDDTALTMPTHDLPQPASH